MLRHLNPFLILLVLALAVPALSSCQTMKEHRLASGAAIGTLAGATAGAIIGHQSGHRGGGALIGAATGAALGTGIGYALERQAKKYEEIEDVEVNTVPETVYPPTGEVVPEHITLRISNEMLFDKGSSSLKPQAVDKINQIAQVMRENPDTIVYVRGYASSEGEEEANLSLSHRRAEMVANQLAASRIDPRRIQAFGMGESNPIADNSTESGRAQNRRVEIEVFPASDVR